MNIQYSDRHVWGVSINLFGAMYYIKRHHINIIIIKYTEIQVMKHNH